jgi:cytosine deaminase
MHRDHDHAVPRGVTPVHRLAEMGVNCSLATNNVLNPFTPFGDCSQLRMANLYANVCQVGRLGTMADCFDMVSSRAARLMNREGHAVRPGAPATLVVLDATDPAMAVAEIAQPVMGFKDGRRTFTRPLPELHAPA